MPPLAGFAELVSADAGRVHRRDRPGVRRRRRATPSRRSPSPWPPGCSRPGEVSVEFATEVAARPRHADGRAARGARDGAGHPGLRAATGDPRRAAGLGPGGADASWSRALDVDARRGRRGCCATWRRGSPRRSPSSRPVQPAAAHPRPRRLPPRPGPDRARRLSGSSTSRASRCARSRSGARTRSPLRDVASMLRSLDHVGRSAGRRAEARNGGPLEQPGLDLDGWLRRSRERFLEAYRAGSARGRGADRRSTRRSSAPSRSRRSATSSSTPRRTCRPGCGRRPRGCAACSSEVRPGRGAPRAPSGPRRGVRSSRGRTASGTRTRPRRRRAGGSRRVRGDVAGRPADRQAAFPRRPPQIRPSIPWHAGRVRPGCVGGRRASSRTTTSIVTVRSISSNGRPTSAHRSRRMSLVAAIRSGGPKPFHRSA